LRDQIEHRTHPWLVGEQSASQLIRVLPPAGPFIEEASTGKAIMGMAH
jgi:hypothetical protein